MGQVLGAALLFGAAGLIAKSLIRTQAIGKPRWRLNRRDKIAAVLIGIFGGFIVGLTSVGSGVFFGLSLLVIFPMRHTGWSGRTSFTRPRFSTSPEPRTLGGREHRLRDPLLAAPRLDSRSADRRPAALSIPEQSLRLVLAGVLGLAGIKLLDVPGGEQIILVVLSAGLVALLVLIGRQGWMRVNAGGNGRVPSAADWLASTLELLGSIARRCARSGSASTRWVAIASRRLRRRVRRSSVWSRFPGRSTRAARASARSTRLPRAWALRSTRPSTSTLERRWTSTPARSRADLRRRLVAARAGPVHRARPRGRLRHAPDAPPTPSRPAPIPWAILSGLARTGVTLFEIVDATADSGAIVGQAASTSRATKPRRRCSSDSPRRTSSSCASTSRS